MKENPKPHKINYLSLSTKVNFVLYKLSCTFSTPPRRRRRRSWKMFLLLRARVSFIDIYGSEVDLKNVEKKAAVKSVAISREAHSLDLL